MRFADFKIGKIYSRTLKEGGGGGRERSEIVYKMIIVDKDEEKGLLASIVPDTGKPTPPQWYGKDSFQRWKPYEKRRS